ncbi:MAG: GAF domain-containing sensor histidine kinase [Actinomycetota bacterium]|nr:GAF domain-containing sensor histidine kinase [Actinomycetota bacterium]
MEYLQRLDIPQKKRTYDELRVLIVVFRWITLVLALAHVLVARSAPGFDGLLIAAVALSHTALVTFLVLRRVSRRALFVVLDATTCGLLLLFSGALLSGYGAYAAGSVLLSALLFGSMAGLSSATIVAIFFVTTRYLAQAPGLVVATTGYGVLTDITYIAALYIAAVFFAQVSLIIKRHKDTALRLEENINTLSSIYDVASMISSKFFLDDILESVVDQAKRIIKTDKTVLHLIDIDARKRALSRHMVAVRGRRSEHPESWWRTQIEDIAEEVIASGHERLISRAPEGVEGAGSWLLCVPVKVKDRSVGLLSAMNSYGRGFTENDIAALKILASFAAVAIENARLINRAQLLLVADERNRIAKEMHDGLAQSLFSLVLNLQVCRKKIDDDPLSVKEKMGEMQTVASQGMAELRRYIYDLRPKNLEDMGLIGAIGFHLEEINKLNGSSGRLRTYGKRRSLPPRAESAIYRVVQEATNNIVKYANVDNFTVSLKYLEDRVELLIVDKGRGFDVASALMAAEKRETFGLMSMRERIVEQGGELRIESDPDGGTVIRVSLPVEELCVG